MRSRVSGDRKGKSRWFIQPSHGDRIQLSSKTDASGQTLPPEAQ
jgi:hypothetical protein